MLVLGSVLSFACVPADLADLADLGATGEGPAGSSSNVYREGNAWVQEIKGTMSTAKVIKVSTESGSVRVTGSERNYITYTLRKKVFTSSEETARRRFQQFKITAWTTGETATFRGECETESGRTSVDFDIQVPKNVTLVYVAPKAAVWELRTCSDAPTCRLKAAPSTPTTSAARSRRRPPAGPSTWAPRAAR